MKVELSRFRVKPGKSEQVDAWLKMINDNMDEALQTLEREQMQLEVIFREIINGEEYLCWFTVEGEGAGSVNTSPFELDHKHIAYHEECIDHDYGRHDAQPQVILVPQKIAQAMEWLEPQNAKVEFQPREIIRKRPQNRDKDA
jgi:hypothetical protein